jgi:hypothetical protein
MNEDPRERALAAQGQSELGDALFKPIVEAAQRAMRDKGLPEQALMQAAMARGFGVIEAEAIDQLDREASEGDTASANLRNQWRDHKWPESRGAKWRRGHR